MRTRAVLVMLLLSTEAPTYEVDGHREHQPGVLLGEIGRVRFSLVFSLAIQRSSIFPEDILIKNSCLVMSHVYFACEHVVDLAQL